MQLNSHAVRGHTVWLIRHWNLFSEKSSFWISCNIFRNYLLIHFSAYIFTPQIFQHKIDSSKSQLLNRVKESDSNVTEFFRSSIKLCAIYNISQHSIETSMAAQQSRQYLTPTAWDLIWSIFIIFSYILRLQPRREILRLHCWYFKRCKNLRWSNEQTSTHS